MAKTQRLTADERIGQILVALWNVHHPMSEYQIARHIGLTRSPYLRDLLGRMEYEELIVKVEMRHVNGTNGHGWWLTEGAHIGLEATLT